MMSDEELSQLESESKRYYAVSGDVVIKLIQEIRELKSIISNRDDSNPSENSKLDYLSG